MAGHVTQAPLVLDGAPYELGRRHGEAWAGQIRAHVADNLRSLSILAERRTGTALEPAEIVRRSEPHLDALEQQLPELHAETRGIAVGAGLELRELFTLNGFLDLYDLTFPRLEDPAVRRGGCTAFAARDSANDTRWALVGQNYDVRGFLADGVFLADVRPDGAPRALVATLAGMVGCAGVNEAGVAVVINNLTPTDGRAGLFHQYVVRHILTRETLGDALDAVLALPRASGYSYIVGDGSGEFVGLETSGTDAVPYHPGRDGFVCHCNHYVLEPMRRFETPGAALGDSISRFGRAQSLLLELDGEHPFAAARSLCRDHANRPRSICRHRAAGGGPLTDGQTVFSLIVNLLDRSLELCVGQPCEREYVEHRF
jgi:isopenicillin-N N-acyltransferase-like protein